MGEPNNLITFAELKGDSSFATPELMLRDSLQDLLNDSLNGCKPNKGLVLFLEARDGNYDLQMNISNLSCSEAISLLEIAKMRMYRRMSGL